MPKFYTRRGFWQGFALSAEVHEAPLDAVAGRGIVERQPFDGPLYARSGSEVHVLGATLARAMRVSEDA